MGSEPLPGSRPGGVGPLLTVVVPTIPGRESLLSRCLFSLTEQAPDSVEILVVGGTGLLGDKANAAAQVAQGSHMTVVDDDDWLAADYMTSVLPEVAADPDYVGLKVLELDKGRYSNVVATSAEFGARWGRDGRRGPVPKGVTRTSIWRACPLGNEYAADRDWLAKVSGLVRSWRFVDRCLYVYDYWPHRFGSVEQRDVGVWPFDESRICRLTVDR